MEDRRWQFAIVNLPSSILNDSSPSGALELIAGKAQPGEHSTEGSNRGSTRDRSPASG